jgi:hypothetical protein
MRFIRMLAGLLILLCLVPPLVLVAAALIGRWIGCEVDPDAPHACRLLGGDYGDILYSLVRFGDNAGAAIAVLMAVLVSWALIEIAGSVGRSPRKKPAPQTPASSRNRERGS